MYYEVVSQCAATLKTIEGWLDKAEEFAASKRFDVDVLMGSRLAPDMGAFIYQVQSACDYVKGAAGWLSGQTPPKHDDTERTIDEVRERIAKTLAFVGNITPAAYAGAADRIVKVNWASGKSLEAPNYVLQIAIPNIYFHLV